MEEEVVGDNQGMKPEIEMESISSTCLPMIKGHHHRQHHHHHPVSSSESDSVVGENGKVVENNRSGEFLKMNMGRERGPLLNSVEQIKKDDDSDGEGFDLGSASRIVEEEKNQNNNSRKRRRESAPSGVWKVDDKGVESLVEWTAASGGFTDRQRTTTTRRRRIVNISTTIMPSEAEIEGFFAKAEMEQTMKFIDRYNFDVVNDVPMEGRYQWVKLF